MNYYHYKDKKIMTKKTYNFKEITEEEMIESDLVYFLYEMEPDQSKDTYILNSSDAFEKKEESIDEINKRINVSNLKWINQKITNNQVIGVNTSYETWEEILQQTEQKQFKVNLLGLGDVGSTLLIGLRLLGKDVIDEIGIYDLDEQKMDRWEQELNQVCYPEEFGLPKIKIKSQEELFDCDMFIFTASKFVPKVGSKTKDVRMAQFKANADIIKYYAAMAKNENFKGIFSVISDPVDLLCNVVLDTSALRPSQIRGYGLGVMNGRANYYSEVMGLNYSQEGRVFGPHGKGLIVADSIENYNDEHSIALTNKVITANLEIRALGFKPYIAPALSSGALSIVETLKGHWNYSTVFIDGIYWGIKNRYINNSVQIEPLQLPEALMARITKSYKELKDTYENNKNS